MSQNLEKLKIKKLKTCKIQKMVHLTHVPEGGRAVKIDS